MRLATEGTETENLFETVANKSPVGLYIVQDGKFCYTNPPFQSTTGYTEDELLGRDSLELVVPEDRERVRENAIKMLKGELTLPYQFRVTHKNDSIRWVMESVVPIRYRGRQAALGYFVDITERKQLEEALKEREEQYRELANSITDIFFAMDDHLRYTYWNKASEVMIGIRAEDAIGKSLREIFPDTPEMRNAEKVYRNVLKTRQAQTFVNDFDIDGSHYIFEISAYPSRDGISVFVKDITERKQAEEALRESEERYRALFDRSLDCVYVHDFEGNFLDANETALKLFGYEREDIPQLNFASLLNQDQLPAAFATLQELKDTGAQKQVNQFRLRCKDGSFVDVETRAMLIYHEGKPYAIQGVGRDITERKKMEEALRQSEENYRALFESSVIGTVVIDAETMKLVMANKAAAEMFGLSSVEEAIGANPLDFAPPEGREGVLKLIVKELFEQDLQRTRELRLITKDGREIWVSATAARIMHEGRLAGLVSLTDTTERKEMEEAIRQAAEEWRRTFDSISDAISIHGRDFRILRANKAFADIFHIKPSQIIGKHCYELHHGDKPISGCPHKQTLATEKPAVAEFYESQLGKFFLESTSPIFNEQGEVVGTVHIIRDITEQKQQNEQLMMAGRLASVGELAAGTAHELNNPLTSVIGFSQLLMEKNIPDDIREDVKLIYNEAQRAANVTKNLLTFARKHTPVKQLSQISNIIEDVLKLRAYEHKLNGIEVKRQLAPDLPEIMVDYYQMQQVFMNIIINAEYFMTEAHKRGTLNITTKKHNSSVRISITDDGPGIPEENLSWIFDPFFTTKEAGKGTGLGLSICHGIVTEHGGQIYAKSQPGKGATFVVELPINGH